MKYQLRTFRTGNMYNNAYVVSDDETKDAVIIDTSFAASRIIDYIEENGLHPLAVLTTHGHYDHIEGNREVCEHFGIPAFIHEADADMVKDGEGYRHDDSAKAVYGGFLHDGEKLQFGSIECTVIHTPGHSRGSVCFLIDNTVFTGDTLFYHDVGRSDLEGGSEFDLMHSIKEKLLTLPVTYCVCPGHGGSTLISEEMQRNKNIR